MSQADTAIAFELAQVGKPYQWGATGPDSFDCSGLQVAGWHAAGVALPRTSYQMMSRGRAVTKQTLAPGDLVFPHPGHVQMYLGNGYVVEAPHTGGVVQVVPLYGVYAARRVADIPAASAIIRNVDTGQMEINPAFHIPNPLPYITSPFIPKSSGGLGAGGSAANSVVNAVIAALPKALFDSLFQPFVDVFGKYVWRGAMLALGGLLLLIAVWQWKPVQQAAKQATGHAKNLAKTVAA